MHIPHDERIGMIVTAKQRKSVLKETAGISGIHMKTRSKTRLNATDNNLKRATNLKDSKKQILQAEETTKYRDFRKN